jgi:drug/metabolite transporter (DMT)-like permease
MSTTAKAFLALTLTMLIWAVAPIVTRLLVTRINPGDTLVIRYAISVVLFAVLLTVTRNWRFDSADWPRILLAAATGVFGYNVANVFGYETTSASLGVIIIGGEPAMIAVLAALILGEPLRRPVLAGFALAMVGTILLLAGENVGTWTGLRGAPVVLAVPPAADLKGPLLILLSAFCWSLFVVIIKPLLVKYGTIKASALNGVVGTPMIMLLARHQTLEVAASLTNVQWAYILFLAVLGTVASIFLWNYGVRHVSAASAGAFIYALPAASVSLAVPILGESLTPTMLAGGILILTGVGVAQLRG